MKILVRISVGAFVAIETAACRPSDVLSVPAPASVVATGSLNNRTGAEGAFNSAKAQLFSATYGYFRNGLLMWDGLLTDEFTLSALTFYGFDANIDARMTTIRGTFAEDGDYPWERLLQARSDLLLALPGLAQYEPTSARSSVGEAHALAGYAELLVAESYCAGTPLDAALPGGTIRYTMPLTTDSLLGVAEAHFDSAIGTANGDAGVAALASVGLGRVLVDRGRYAAAAAAVASVLTNFVYNAELEPSFNNGATQSPSVYAVGVQSNFYRLVNVADQEGTNGLNFVSAHDPRLRLDSTLGPTEDGASAWYLPTKFEANLSTVPLATGIEARLIEAEAALKANDPATWLADLNTLRNSGCTVPGVDSTCALGTGQVPSQTTGLASLSDPGTDSGRVSLMFRERAFWLFGTAHRLGDLRRLIRQYGRDQSTVFPSGPYANGTNPHLPAPIPNYGTDVALTLPTPHGLSSSSMTETNPQYKGCITPTTAA